MGGAFARCSGEFADGGCGHLHRDDPLPDLRALAGLGPRTEPPPRHVRRLETGPVVSDADLRERPQDRPAGACVTHLPPRPGFSWRRADDGYRTCTGCYDLLHRWLSPLGTDDEGRPDNIPYLYLTLDPRPGNSGPGRRSPGFTSRSPANDHIIAMADPRTTQVTDDDPCSAQAILRSWVLCVWDERYDDEALNHTDYRRRRASLPLTVDGASVWLDKQLDWLTRHEMITEFHAEMKELRRQLRGATGDGGQPPVGHCIEILDTGECRTPIYMPKGEKPRAPDEPIRDLPSLECPACGTGYSGVRLLRLKLSEKPPGGAGTPAA